MSNGKSGSSDLVLVAGICVAMSLVVWLFLVQFYDELFAPSGATARVTTTAPASDSVAGDVLPSTTQTIEPVSTADASGSAQPNAGETAGAATRLTKSALPTDQAPAAEKTIFDVEEDENIASQQVELETSTERSTRLMRETLGISKRTPPTHALDVSLIGGGECVKPEEKTFLVPVLFSYNGASLRGASFVDLNALLAVYRRCGKGFFKMSVNSAGQADASESLMLMRLDELKYFFKQNGVPLESLMFPSNL